MSIPKQGLILQDHDTCPEFSEKSAVLYSLKPLRLFHRWAGVRAGRCLENWLRELGLLLQGGDCSYVGVSKNQGPYTIDPNSRAFITRTPHIKDSQFQETAMSPGGGGGTL